MMVRSYQVLAVALASALALGCADSEPTVVGGYATVRHDVVVGLVDGMVVPPADTLGTVDSTPPGNDTTPAPDTTPAADTTPAPDTTPAADTTPAPDTTPPTDTAPPGCPLGHACNPHIIATTPYSASHDTAQSTSSEVDSYSCAPSTNESGPEIFYRLDLTEVSVVTATINEVPGDGIDVDVHVTTATDGSGCIIRDNDLVRRVLRPGTYYIIVDSWVNGAGASQQGAYTLDVDIDTLGSGNCAMGINDQPMFWTACADGVDCYMAPVEGTNRGHLRMPTYGAVVKEAHLVTIGESFANTWPSSGTDGIPNHYALSQAESGYVMNRTEPWAPAGEGGSLWGQGSTGAKIPRDAEAWYVNMYWRYRPDAGTRLIIFNPANGKAVVAAGGYETGPGSNARIGGVAEEVHHHLGTNHLSELVIGFATDQSLTYGPITCN